MKSFEHNYLVLEPEPVQTWQSEQRDMFCYCNNSLHVNTNNTNNSNWESAAVCSASIYGDCIQSKRTITGELCSNLNNRFRRSVQGSRKEREMKRRQQLIYKETEALSKVYSYMLKH